MREQTSGNATGSQIDYVGNELELFDRAIHWKRYLGSRLCSYLQGDVLEVGAGLGANVPHFHRHDLRRWVSLEPDQRLCDEYLHRQAQGMIPSPCQLVHGTLADLPDQDAFDTIVYIDVLEHIEDDRREFEQAFQRLRSGGHLIILCPAHNFLFSPFDKAIGHYRRYNKRMYRGLSSKPPVKLEYLDSVGMFASVANKMLLRQSYPTAQQIAMWDNLFVPTSSWLDSLILRTIGKSLLGVWRN